MFFLLTLFIPIAMLVCFPGFVYMVVAVADGVGCASGDGGGNGDGNSHVDDDDNGENGDKSFGDEDNNCD